MYCLKNIVQVNAAIAFFTLLPLPGSDGFTIFAHRRWWWLMAFVFVGVYYLLVVYFGIYSFVIATAFALLGAYLLSKSGG